MFDFIVWATNTQKHLQPEMSNDAHTAHMLIRSYKLRVF